MAGLNIYKRRDFYYWRRRIPQVFAPFLQKSDFRRSLDTKFLIVAENKAFRLNSAFDDFIRELKVTVSRQSITREQANAILDSMLARALDDAEWDRAQQPKRTLGEIEQASSYYKEEAERYSRSLATNDQAEIIPLLEKEIDSLDLSGSVDEATLRFLARKGLQQMVQASKINAKRELGIYDEEPVTQKNFSEISVAQPIEPVSTPIPEIKPQKLVVAPVDGVEIAEDQAEGYSRDILMSTAFDGFIAFKTKKGWSQTMITKALKAKNMFIDVFGDVKAREINRHHAETYKNILESIPKLHGKKEEFSGPVREVVAKANALEKEQISQVEARFIGSKMGEAEIEAAKSKAKIQRLAPKTVNDYIDRAGSVFKWLKDEKKVSIDNPFYKIRTPKKEIQKIKGTKKRSYSKADLQKLFTSPLYCGSKTKRLRSAPGPQIFQDALYWVPLAVAFNGLRPEELCQIFLEDIVKEEGVWCFHICREPDQTYKSFKKVKTGAGTRKVPIHQFLIKLGFLKFVEERRLAGRLLLFPELKRDSNNNLWGHTGKNFNYYRHKINLGGDERDLYATRHSFDTQLLNLGVPEIMVKACMGHEQEGETAATYFGGYNPQVVKENIDKLDYGLEMVEVNGNTVFKVSSSD